MASDGGHSYLTLGAARARHFVAKKMQEHAKSQHDASFLAHIMLNDTG